MSTPEERRAELYEATRPKLRTPRLAVVPPPVAPVPALTARETAAVLGRAGDAAFPFLAAVRSRNARAVRQAWDSLSRDGQAALAVMLAEAADPMRLKTVKEGAD